ncbi:hypothetical protein [Pseudomonas sp.]|uniref:hypothetical protein n=1 Tax=Pseudomonas sp. TaxID=306 RepID=UPI002487424D|nr:hypothetical protein [Pseudomonas sp.]MDI1333230.1 hypothetical protein [Pseudomonas sp.]
MSDKDKLRTCVKCCQLKAVKNSRWYIEAWLCMDCYAALAKKKNNGHSSGVKNKP